jgi:AcrR family transcriptional regulator
MLTKSTPHRKLLLDHAIFSPKEMIAVAPLDWYADQTWSRTRPSRIHMTESIDNGGVRERILSAALAVLREDGIAELTQVQVARRAGVRQSHLTYYFPKRHDLLEAVSVRFIDGMERGLRELAAQAAGGDAGELLGRLAAAIGEPGHMRMFTGVVVAADGDPALRAVIVRETRRVQAILAGVLGGDDTMQRAGLLLAAMWGLGFYGFAIGEPAADGSTLLAYLAGGSGG